jgi:hypothetical protein
MMLHTTKGKDCSNEWMDGHPPPITSTANITGSCPILMENDPVHAIHVPNPIVHIISYLKCIGMKQPISEKESINYH